MPGFDRAAQARLARALKQEATRLGFEGCGISAAGPLDDEARRLERWLLEGRHGSMAWMERHFDKRIDPTRLVDGARSVVSVLCSYYQPVEAPDRTAEGARVGKISRYAWGEDYHGVLKDKLYRLYHWLGDEVGGEVHGRAFVDSAPVMDKAWAARAGLGWQGKHTNLLNRDLGSFFFLGELIVDVPLAPDGPVADHCGSCTRCLDACPTDALYQPYALDANRCISYLTIEDRARDVPEPLTPDLDGWVFGCDICQDVCPWNTFKRPTQEDAFAPREGAPDTALRDWVELRLEAFEERFKNTPVTRATHEGFVRNARANLAALGDEKASD